MDPFELAKEVAAVLFALALIWLVLWLASPAPDPIFGL